MPRWHFRSCPKKTKTNGFQNGHDKYCHKWLRVKNTNKTK